MGLLDPCVVEQLLDRWEHGVPRELRGHRRAAIVAGKRGGEDVVVLLERGNHGRPRLPRVGEAVEQDEGRAGAATVKGKGLHSGRSYRAVGKKYISEQSRQSRAIRRDAASRLGPARSGGYDVEDLSPWQP